MGKTYEVRFQNGSSIALYDCADFGEAAKGAVDALLGCLPVTYTPSDVVQPTIVRYTGEPLCYVCGKTEGIERLVEAETSIGASVLLCMGCLRGISCTARRKVLHEEEARKKALLDEGKKDPMLKTYTLADLQKACPHMERDEREDGVWVCLECGKEFDDDA